LPTAEVRTEGARSIHPQPHAPMLILTLWAGDLGLDSGIPQNVYELDAREMVQIYQDGKPLTTDRIRSTLMLEVGDEIDLPGGTGPWSSTPLIGSWPLMCAMIRRYFGY